MGGVCWNFLLPRGIIKTMSVVATGWMTIQMTTAAQNVDKVLDKANFSLNYCSQRKTLFARVRRRGDEDEVEWNQTNRNQKFKLSLRLFRSIFRWAHDRVWEFEFATALAFGVAALATNSPPLKTVQRETLSESTAIGLTIALTLGWTSEWAIWARRAFCNGDINPSRTTRGQW